MRLLLAAPLLAALSAQAAPFTATEMMRLKRIADPQVSPDGKWVAFAATDVDLSAGTRNSEIWLVSLTGGEPRAITSHPRSDTRPRWSPDGKRIAFVSSRDGSSQAYVLDLGGGEARRVTSLSTEADGVLWIDEKTLLVTSRVFPDCGADDACNKKMAEAAARSSARVYDRLLFRHWDTWHDGKRGHLLAVPLEGGPARDLTPGDKDVPPWSLGGPDDYAVSPDGLELCFARKDDAAEALSTNADLYVVPVAGGTPKRVADAPGYDGSPQYSPDGSHIAYRSQARAGYESDRWRLMVLDRKTGASREAAAGFDRPVEGFAWSKDGRALFFVAPDKGVQPIYSVPAAGGEPRPIATEGTYDELQVADAKSLTAVHAKLTHPNEVVRVDVDKGVPERVTRLNDAVLAPFALRPAESVTYPGAAGKDVQAWIVTPPGFDPARRYPLLVIIHGGPQGAWNDGWTYRWNAQVFANAGYVVFMPNPRGSVGFGQEFTDDVNADWGGRAYEDVMRGTDFAITLPYVDKARTAAAGASYGGYLVNWIAGHTDRFDALISHDGTFDLVSMYGGTEELWFMEWEFRGPHWINPEAYARWSPSGFVKSFKTPTLVIHGELDYRIPIEQGLQMFTALQRRGVPSRLLVFPDENHWVLKPANSVRWYQEFLGWLAQWVKE